MPYNFQCPNCEVEQPASDGLAGSEVRCPGCEQLVEVPTRDAAQQSRRNSGASGDGDDDGGDDDASGFVSFGGDKSESREAEMDMTPMVDVTFLLLIFFMVTAAFTLQKSMEIPKPENVDEPSTVQTDDEQENEAVTIHIDADNTFRVITADDEFECPSQQEMFVRLRGAMNAMPRPERLIVRANGDCLHERVVTALDAGTEVGIEDIQLVTVDEDY